MIFINQDEILTGLKHGLNKNSKYSIKECGSFLVETVNVPGVNGQHIPGAGGDGGDGGP